MKKIGNVSKKSSKAPFSVGDKVVSDFHRGEEHLVRSVTECVPYPKCGSAWLVSADGGEACPLCKRTGGKMIVDVDSAWFSKAPESPESKQDVHSDTSFTGTEGVDYGERGQRSVTGSVWVKCESRAQFCYMVAWCEDSGMGTPLRSGSRGYPAVLVIDGGGGAWWGDLADAGDRCVPFGEFVAQRGKA